MSDKFIEGRDFFLTLISAANLPNVRKHFKTRVHARVSFGGDKNPERRTPADKHGELNPTWNCAMKYMILEPGIMHYGLQLVIKFYCTSKLEDRYVGETYASVKDLFDEASRCGGSVTTTLPIKTASAETVVGELKFSYRFGEKKLKKKPGFWKRVVLPGACNLLRVVGVATLGVYAPISYNPGPDVVDADNPPKTS